MPGPLQYPMSLETQGKAFWSANQPGFRFASGEPGDPAFYREVEEHRYSLEPHIPEIARFESWRDTDVLEVGCGIATDGARFARSGARYVGLDRSTDALELARRRFDLEGLEGRFESGPATELPFPEGTFDLVYSHGVLHHIEGTEAAVAEIRRVLRPGGRILVMLYHRDSVNYRLTILIVRRALAALLLIPGADLAIALATGEDRRVLQAHRELLAEHGLRYLTDRELFLSNNTDGPENPLSKVYSRAEARALLSGFDDVRTAARFLNLRIVPGGARLSATAIGSALGRRAGWHLYATGTKPPSS